MARTHFSPKKGSRFGANLAMLGPVAVGITANTTHETHLGGVHRKAYLHQISMSVQTVPADADGAITCIFYKRDASANSDVALTAAFDLETGLTADETVAVPLLSTLTEAQRRLDVGDILFVIVTNDSAALTTAAANLLAGAEVGFIE